MPGGYHHVEPEPLQFDTLNEVIVNPRTLHAVVAACALLVPLAAHAQEVIHPKLGARVYLDVGAYAPAIDTELRVDSSAGLGTIIDLEDDLNFEDRPALPYALLNLRLGERWRIEGEYFALNRDRTTVIDRELEIGDAVFPINSTVNAHFDSDIYRLSVGYSFLKRPTHEVGIALGVHVTTFELGIRTDGALVTVSESADTLAPLPTLGFYGSYAFSPKWLLQGRADLFSLEYEDYSGSLFNLNVGIEYQLAKHVGLGGGYRYVDLELTADKALDIGSSTADVSGEFQYQYRGPTLYLSFNF